MAEVEKEKINCLDEVAKLKLEKMQEAETYLENYRTEKLQQIQDDMDKQIDTNYKRVEELAELNAEYQQRKQEVEDLSSSLELEKRGIALKEKLFNEEQEDFKKLMESEIEFHRKEMTILIDAKDQQIRLMEEKLKTYIKECEAYREEVLSENGKSKKELVTDVEYLRKRMESMQTELQNKPSDAYITGLEAQIKGYSGLEAENKKQALRIAGLENERHNWQIAVNEISKLTEEKAILEEKLTRGKNTA